MAIEVNRAPIHYRNHLRFGDQDSKSSSGNGVINDSAEAKLAAAHCAFNHPKDLQDFLDYLSASGFPLKISDIPNLNPLPRIDNTQFEPLLEERLLQIGQDPPPGVGYPEMEKIWGQEYQTVATALLNENPRDQIAFCDLLLSNLRGANKQLAIGAGWTLVRTMKDPTVSDVIKAHIRQGLQGMTLDQEIRDIVDNIGAQ